MAHQAPLSMEFPRQEYWSGFPFPSLEDLPNPGITPMSSALQVDSLPLSHLGSPMLLGFHPNILDIFVQKKKKQEKIRSRFIHSHKVLKVTKIHLVGKWINSFMYNNVDYYSATKRNELSRHVIHAEIINVL